jgi:3-hydroxyisobutyrate dehydrogenase-like beta-hydroxyacid dehydrogenase
MWEAAMYQKVAVIGTGRMGSALAAALLNKGFVTTVWNRTAAKTEPLSRLGVCVAKSMLEAVDQADVVIVNINNYDSTIELLRHPEIEAALRGKILVQLSSGTPDEAREMQSWAQPLGIEYLDGAILSYPVAIGKPGGTVLYSGSEQLFKRAKPVLLAFGDNAMFVGDEIGHASALDVAALIWGTSAMIGFLQGYVVCEAENMPVERYMQLVKDLMPVLESIVADLYARVRAKNYDNTQAALETWAVGPREVIGWSKAHGVDHGIADPQLLLIEKAVKTGKGQADFAYLYEVLKKSSA